MRNGRAEEPVLEPGPCQAFQARESHVVARTTQGIDSSLRPLAPRAGISQGVAVFGQLFREELQGDRALELGVFRLVADTHPSAAELLDNPVA